MQEESKSRVGTLTNRPHNDRYFKFVDYGATTTPRKQYLRYTYDGWLVEVIHFYVNGSVETLRATWATGGQLGIGIDDQFDDVGLWEEGYTVEISQRCFDRLRKCVQQT